MKTTLYQISQEMRKKIKALNQFKKQYPNITSADLQTFILGWEVAIKSIAASELLEALIELTDCDYTSGTHLSYAIAKAKKAIKKATE